MRKTMSRTFIKTKEHSIIHSSSNKLIGNNQSSTSNSKIGSKTGFKSQSHEYIIREDLNILWNSFGSIYDFNFIEELNDVEFFRKFCDFSKKYKILVSSDCNLIASTNEAKIILKEVRYWIIFIHTNLYRFSYEKIVKIFNHALDNNNIVDVEFFFEYFLFIVEKFSTLEVKNLDSQMIPKKFIEIYLRNKQNIFSQINLAIDENVTIENFPNSKEINITKIDEENQENEFSFSHENYSEKILINDQLFEDKNLIDDSFSEKSLGKFVWNDRVSVDTSIYNLKFYESKENEITDNKVNHKSVDNNFPIKNEDLNDEKENQGINTENFFHKYIGPNNEKSSNDEKINDKSELLENEEIELPKIKQNNIKIVFEEEQIHDSFYIVENNYHNCGNFAILELSEESKSRYGTAYIVTPLKHYKEKSEIRNANNDLKKISDHKKYCDFTYKPYNESLSKILLQYTKIINDNKKYCFNEIK